MISIKSETEIENMAVAAKVVAKIHQQLKAAIKPGMNGIKLNLLAEKIIKENGCEPNFKGYYGFPASICVSVNEQLVHGIPTHKPFKNGDLVSIDAGCKYKNYHADAAFSVLIGDASKEHQRLLEVTKNALDKAIAILKPGIKTGLIGEIIQKYVESAGFYLPRNYTGHGIGLAMHEEPAIPNYGHANQGIMLKPGMVICIEPMVQIGTEKTRTLKDGWTVVSVNHLYTAHFEHTIAITKDGYRILSKL